MAPRLFDVGLGWAHPADQAFAEMLRLQAREARLSLREITYENLETELEDILAGRVRFGAFIDRSSEDHPGYVLISSFLKAQGVPVLNDPHRAARFGSKAQLYRLFCKEKLPVLPTRVLSPGENARTQYGRIVQEFGRPFVLKPSHGGGGEHVVLTGRTMRDMEHALQEVAPDEVLVQPYLSPGLLGGRTGWFRCLYAAGTVIPLWWDPKNSFYQLLGRSPEEQDIQGKLQDIMGRIARLTGLELFSTEAALDSMGNLQIVDYLNHPIDLNTQDRIPSGLPRPVVKTVAAALLSHASQLC